MEFVIFIVIVIVFAVVKSSTEKQAEKEDLQRKYVRDVRELRTETSSVKPGLRRGWSHSLYTSIKLRIVIGSKSACPGTVHAVEWKTTNAAIDSERTMTRSMKLGL
jgi:hypothetical protein